MTHKISVHCIIDPCHMVEAVTRYVAYIYISLTKSNIWYICMTVCLLLGKAVAQLLNLFARLYNVYDEIKSMVLPPYVKFHCQKVAQHRIPLPPFLFQPYCVEAIWLQLKNAKNASLIFDLSNCRIIWVSIHRCPLRHNVFLFFCP